MEEIILHTTDLTKRYGKTNAVNGVNICIKKGDIYGFVGHNGSGKTTLMRMVASLIKPTSGSFTLFGGDGSNRANLSRISSMIESPAIYPTLNAYNNIKSQCFVCNIPLYKHETVINQLLELVGLSDTAKKKSKDFSLGMRQRLGIAMALVGEPEFMLLDEPTNGLDPQGIHEIRELLVKLNRDHGITILISSHILSELEKLATRYGFINKGILIKEITPSEIAKECGERTLVTVDNIPATMDCLNKAKLVYSVNGSTFSIDTDMNAGELFKLLTADGINILSSQNTKVDLETYFLDLVGGKC